MEAFPGRTTNNTSLSKKALISLGGVTIEEVPVILNKPMLFLQITTKKTQLESGKKIGSKISGLKFQHFNGWWPRDALLPGKKISKEDSKGHNVLPIHRINIIPRAPPQ